MVHIPVLEKEVLEYLNPKANENFIDATIGEGGHTIGILKANSPNGRVLGIDADSEQIKNCENKLKKFKNRLILVNDSYINLKKIVRENNFSPVDGILFDFGMSSWHLEKSGRGFSFLRDEPLDMRYEVNDQKQEITAETIINEWTEKEIRIILKEYANEKFFRRIAKEIVRRRKEKPIKSTLELKDIVVNSIPKRFRHSKIHCATRTFQALRIAVNRELNNIECVLPQAIDILKKGGRIVFISFHSLEDRIVKKFLKCESQKESLKILAKKPIIANLEEIKKNPRSRSAKLRAAVKI